MTTTPASPASPANAALPASAAGTFLLGGDLPVSRMGFGAMKLPSRDWEGPACDPEQSVRVLRRAVELGVDHIDTAWFYFFRDVSAHGLIRRALHPYRDGLVIATKVGPGRDPEGRWLDPADREALRAAVHRDLRELGVDRLDVVHLRRMPSQSSIAEPFAALAELREEGLIRHLGVSNVTEAQLAEAEAIAPVVTVQNKFSLLERTAEQDRLLADCTARGIAFVPFYPLGGSGVPDHPALRRVAERHGATRAQVMVAWLLALSPSVLAIPGTSSPAHLEENIAAAALRLSPADLAELEKLAASDK
ncbi:oxidoreductase [Kitasatospora purpeofusca]|uniref:oxidoreductase n=1 Tax=Kitasatospora purpeofusca TaxID=67352 RepID=UPI0022556E4F|nr:oxidoreductase [Kitasatospora purpeofusca]MCX4753940.1 oxidoreductase [Kitasatospora purpeofusca]WSR33404.1 oxidoreductase [Kitasatospora purpeofusca]WSR41486.1 oxidoreductase [Kitasatospora purpeofusca]